MRDIYSDDVWDDVRRMQAEMEAFRNNFSPFNTGMPALQRTRQLRNFREPLTDVYETDSEVVITMELPGINKEEIRISAADDGIEVRVEKRSEREDTERGMRTIERSYEGFYKYVPLTAEVDTERIDATYNNGVLEIRAPKSEQGRRKQVNVK
jgi:HSP20 family protein